MIIVFVITGGVLTAGDEYQKTYLNPDLPNFSLQFDSRQWELEKEPVFDFDSGELFSITLSHAHSDATLEFRFQFTSARGFPDCISIFEEAEFTIVGHLVRIAVDGKHQYLPREEFQFKDDNPQAFQKELEALIAYLYGGDSPKSASIITAIGGCPQVPILVEGSEEFIKTTSNRFVNTYWENYKEQFGSYLELFIYLHNATGSVESADAVVETITYR